MFPRSLEGTFSKKPKMFTPPKTNISPEKWCLEDVVPIDIVPFLGDMLIFKGVFPIHYQLKKNTSGMSTLLKSPDAALT